MAQAPAGFQGLILANTEPPFGQIMQAGINQRAQQGQQLAELYQRQQEQKQQEDYKKSQLLKDELDPSKYQTPSEKVNNIIDANLAKIQNDLFEKAGSLTLPELTAETQKALLPVIAVDNAAKARIADENKKLELVKQQFPELDIERLSSDTGDNTVDDYFTKNDDSSYTIKKPAQFSDTGTLAYLLDNDASGKYFKNYDNLNQYMGGLINSKNGGFKIPLIKHETEHAGIKKTVQYSGEHSPFYQLNGTVDANGFLQNGQIPQLQLITEQQPIGNGDSIPVIPENLYQQWLGGDQMRNKQLHILYGKEPDSGAGRPSGITPGSPEDDIFFRHWLAVKYIPQNDPSYIAPVTEQSNSEFENKLQAGVPLYSPHNTTATDAGVNWVGSTISAIRNGDKDALRQQMNKLNAGNGHYKFSDFDIDPDSRQIIIRYKVGKQNVPQLNQQHKPIIDRTTGKPVTHEEDKYQSDILSLDDPSLEYKLGGLYQSLMGGDTKIEKNLVNTPNNPQPTQNPNLSKQKIPGFN